jgi:hypothetical protein
MTGLPRSLLKVGVLGAATAVAMAGTVVPAGAADGGRPLSAVLTGAAEAPGPGDPDGSGTADLRVNPGLGQVCVELVVRDIVAATASHIHKAPAGASGPVVVTLAPPSDGTSSGCYAVERALARDILQDPSQYYVNVHNSEYPAGALRGQLSR